MNILQHNLYIDVTTDFTIMIAYVMYGPCSPRHHMFTKESQDFPTGTICAQFSMFSEVKQNLAFYGNCTMQFL